MTIDIDSDNGTKNTSKNFVLPFASSELESAGLRVTRAEFSRIMECSRQAVTDWVKSGRIVVGADGRFDPRQAVRTLLATGDPARIRARVLSPLVAEIDELRARSISLQYDLAALEARRVDAEIASDREYETLERWLDTFVRHIGEIDMPLRGHLDADGWRAYVGETLKRVMADDSYLNQIDDVLAAEITSPAMDELNQQLAGLDLECLEPFAARSCGTEEGADSDEGRV